MILLDTHALIWWVTNDSKLSTAARAAIDAELTNGVIAISSISAWEIAMLMQSGRLYLSMSVDDWLAEIKKIESVQFIPVDDDIGIKSVTLPAEFHKDPADRIIIATARKFNVPLITADAKILAYHHVKTIW